MGTRKDENIMRESRGEEWRNRMHAHAVKLEQDGFVRRANAIFRELIRDAKLEASEGRW
jgi:hypothetical protein